MVSELAKGDYEDLLADGLPATLEDFDRLNRLALRLTDGADTTTANMPRIGWAGDTPFYQPTCAAFAWYLEVVDKQDFPVELKDAAWFFALAHGRKRGAFDGLVLFDDINHAVNGWLKTIPATHGEIVRACRYAAVGFDDAERGKTDAEKAKEDGKTREEKREDSIANLSERVTIASALTGIAPAELSIETPSRLEKMIEAVRANNPMGGGTPDKSHLSADYQLAFREIKKRLVAEKTAKEAAHNGK